MATLEPAKFPWGKIRETIEVGPRYTILAYESRVPSDRGRTMYHPFVDGKDTNSSHHTIEGALIIAIARAKLKLNEDRWMAIAAAKLLGVNEDGAEEVK